MRRLYLLALIAILPLTVDATCVTKVEPEGPWGPWRGRTVNVGDQSENHVEYVADVYDANGKLVPGQVGGISCPAALLPGEVGHFELLPITGAALALATPPSGEFKPPLSVAIHPRGEQIGSGAQRADGLFAEVESTLDFGRIQNVRVTNNSDHAYTAVELCGYEIPTSDSLPPVGWAIADLNRRLAPGESMELSLVFTTGVADLRLYPRGRPDASYPDCCPATGASTWRSVDTGPFSVLLPPGWTYEPDQGLDSFIGDFVGDGMRLHFDYGWYSNSLPYDDNPAYHVHFETIAGRGAKIVYPNNGDGETGIYFPHVTGSGSPFVPAVVTKHNLIAQDLTPAQRDIALQIFRTIRFEAP